MAITVVIVWAERLKENTKFWCGEGKQLNSQKKKQATVGPFRCLDKKM